MQKCNSYYSHFMKQINVIICSYLIKNPIFGKWVIFDACV